MMWHAMARLGVHPAAAVVKIDDTPVGIGEGIAAGTWTVGLALSGNLAGLSAEELAALAAAERDALRDRASAELRAAGAHLVIDSLADLLPALERIETALALGARP
jgi:phosphonoacetaldehyde hydrolase